MGDNWADLPDRGKPGKVETLVLEAWGHGIRIDGDDPAHHGTSLVGLLMRAREIDDNEGRCSHERWHMGYPVARCIKARGHAGEHAEEKTK